MRDEKKYVNKHTRTYCVTSYLLVAASNGELNPFHIEIFLSLRHSTSRRIFSEC